MKILLFGTMLFLGYLLAYAMSAIAPQLNIA